MKLQDAYAAESGAAGAWSVIGYIGPGTKNATGSQTTVFKYTDDFSPADATNKTTMVGSLSTDNAGQAGWGAEALTALNDCAAASKWTVNIKKGTTSSSGSLVEYVASVPTGTGCSSLTANFGNIGK